MIQKVMQRIIRNALQQTLNRAHMTSNLYLFLYLNSNKHINVREISKLFRGLHNYYLKCYHAGSEVCMTLQINQH
jgi:hypothetical protein